MKTDIGGTVQAILEETDLHLRSCRVSSLKCYLRLAQGSNDNEHPHLQYDDLLPELQEFLHKAFREALDYYQDVPNHARPDRSQTWNAVLDQFGVDCPHLESVIVLAYDDEAMIHECRSCRKRFMRGTGPSLPSED